MTTREDIAEILAGLALSIRGTEANDYYLPPGSYITTTEMNMLRGAELIRWTAVYDNDRGAWRKGHCGFIKNLDTYSSKGYLEKRGHYVDDE